MLVAFVIVKVLFEWSGVRAERGGSGLLTGWLSGPDSDTRVEPVDVPVGQPSATVDVDQRSVVAAAVWRVASRTGPFYVVLAAFVWVGVPAFLGEGETSLTRWIVSGVAGLVLLGLMFAGDILEVLLTEGWTTYYRLSDQIVAHDRLTDEPQWMAPISELRDATIVETRPSDRCFGTRSITVTTGWATMRPIGRSAQSVTHRRSSRYSIFPSSRPASRRSTDVRRCCSQFGWPHCRRRRRRGCHANGTIHLMGASPIVSAASQHYSDGILETRTAVISSRTTHR